MKLHCLGLLTALALAPAALADGLPITEPADVGMSADKLEALSQRLQAEIDAGKFPGAIILVARDGKIAHLDTLGKLTPGGAEMSPDAIFRIYSMTKPIVSAMIMALVEDGKLTLADPLDKFIPEFAEMQVATGKDAAGNPVLEPAKRKITIQDLLRHTSGIPYGFFGAGPARDAYRNANVGAIDTDDLASAKLIASLPLEHQPGTVWEYGRSTDILGAVIEVITGQSLGDALKDRIFAPLGMDDTGFGVPDAAEHDRIAEPEDQDRKIGTINVWDPKVMRVYESGGGGLVSTMQDYARFAQMMLNGGELDNVRVLSPSSVAYMTADHNGAKIKPGKYYLPGPGHGFGLGYAVRMQDGVAPFPGSEGTYYWGGAAGTFYFADPEEKLLMLYMMQSPKHRVQVRPILWNMTYGAITDSIAD